MMIRQTLCTKIQPVIDLIHFHGGIVYLIGGAVRDYKMNRTPKDLDFVVRGLQIENLVSILNTMGETNLVGASFSVIKFKYQGTEYDFALPRIEKSTGNGHTDFDIIAEPFIPIESDLARRDFAMNAMAVNLRTGEWIDPFDGQWDCETHLLSMVNTRAFIEDPLRMMRAIQFAARFDLELSTETIENLETQYMLIETVSKERIAIEFCKILQSNRPSIGINLMMKFGLLEYVMPELSRLQYLKQPSKYHAYDVFTHSVMACDAIPIGANKSKTVQLRLAALLHDVGKFDTQSFNRNGEVSFHGHDEVGAKIASTILSRLKFSSVPGLDINHDAIVELIRNHMFECDCESTPKAMRKFIAKIGQPSMFDQIRLRIGDRLAKGILVDVQEWVTFAKKLRIIHHGKKTAFGLCDLAINGNDVQRLLSIGPSSLIGVILNNLLERCIENPEMNTVENLTQILLKIDEV